jgi:uncharacterized membrane protein
MATTMIVLRLIHIFSGVFWAGSVFFVAAFLLPGLRASGPAGGQVMQQVVAKLRYPRAAGSAGVLTILSGAGMYWRNNSISSGAWSRSIPGMTYALGAVAAIAAMVVFATLIGPTGEKLLSLGGAIQSAGGPPSAEQATKLTFLQGKMAFASRLGAGCLAVAVLCMATARYL